MGAVMRQFSGWQLFVCAWMLVVACSACSVGSRTGVEGTSSPPPGGRSVEQQYDAALEVHFDCYLADGTIRRGRGSAVVLNGVQALTAYHVVDNCEGLQGDLKVFTRTGVEFRMAVTDYSERADLAVLTNPWQNPGRFDVPPAQFAALDPLGERTCHATGYPDRSRKCGDLQWSTRDVPGNARTDANVEPGNSGSGVYNRRGQLVGIVTHLHQFRNGQWHGGLFTTVVPHFNKGWICDGC